MIFLPVQTAKNHVGAAGSQDGLRGSLTRAAVTEGRRLEGRGTFLGDTCPGTTLVLPRVG